jgi:hypothetical protein
MGLVFTLLTLAILALVAGAIAGIMWLLFNYLIPVAIVVFTVAILGISYKNGKDWYEA